MRCEELAPDFLGITSSLFMSLEDLYFLLEGPISST